MKTAFIIRFHYEENDQRFSWRLKYFSDEVLPRIKKQKGEFDICVRCNPYHNQVFRDLGCIPFQVKNEYVKYKGYLENGKRYFYDFTPWSNVIGLEKYDLQLGLDSDDLIEPNYLEKIISELEPLIRFKRSVHLCFQPEVFHLKTGEKKPMRTYHSKKGSAFMALYQPNKDKYRFVYEESHLTIIRKADISKVLPVGYCYATAHDINESTGK